MDIYSRKKNDDFIIIKYQKRINNSTSLNVCGFEVEKGVTTWGLGLWRGVYLGLLSFEFDTDEKYKVFWVACCRLIMSSVSYIFLKFEVEQEFHAFFVYIVFVSCYYDFEELNLPIEGQCTLVL